MTFIGLGLTFQNKASGEVEISSNLQIVASGPMANYARDQIAGSSDQRREGRHPILFGSENLTEIRLAYCNYWLDLGAGGRETDTGNAVTLEAALEYNNLTVRATFSGNNSYVMDDGEALIISDPILP